jgi:hypothetical protein
MKTNYVDWAARFIAAIIMLQTLFFKFTGAEESVYIFTTMGVEPWGRIGTGIVELIASILLFVNRGVVWGSILAMGVMAGAILSHVFVLGFIIMDDGGQLFIMALVTFLCAAFLFYSRKEVVIQLLR